MTIPGDWLQWHENRFRLPSDQGGRREYPPNGQPRGIVPFPLTDEEFDLLLKRFFLADDMLTDAIAEGQEILDTEPLQTLRGKLMAWVEAFGQFPTLADTGAHSNNYDALLQPDDYFKWYTVADIKQHMTYLPASQLKDDAGNDLPDDFPVLVLAPRKYGGFGGVVFYHDDWPDSDNWAIYYTKAADFVSDHPEYHDWLISNGGYVSDTDLVVQLHLTRRHFLDSQYVINFILNILIQNIGNLNILFPNIVINYPGAPPGGTWPPGTGPAPDGGYNPVGGNFNTDHIYNCDEHQIYTHTGTNDIDLAANLGFAALAALPLPVYKENSTDIRPAIITAIQATGDFPDLSQIAEVEVCVNFAYLSIVLAQAFGITEPAITSKPVKLTVNTLASVDNPSVSYSFTVPPTEEWATGEFKFNVPALNTTVGAKAKTAVSTGDNTLIFDNWQDIASITLDCELLPSIFGNDNNPFNHITESPYLYIGLKRAAAPTATWRGVQLLGDVDNPCTTVQHPPGFFQDAYQADFKNGGGDTNILFTGVSWTAGIDAVLIEIYAPDAGSGLWMPPSGSSGQSVMDAWRGANPQATYDGSNNLILFNDAIQQNRLSYNWFHLPTGGTTFFAFDQTPNPANCWVRVVAFHKTDGSFAIQDAAHQCNTLTYPGYPGYPF